MKNSPGILANKWILAAIAAAIIVPIIFLTVARGRSDSGDAPSFANQTATAVSGRSSDQKNATDAAKRFIDAINGNDRDTLYALQTDDYKRVCTRDQFNGVSLAASGVTFAGPAKVTVQGDSAAAVITINGSGGATQTNEIPLVRATDGSWRVAARSTTGCS